MKRLGLVVMLIVLLLETGYKSRWWRRFKRDSKGRDNITPQEQSNLMQLFSENWSHIRHMEYYRMWAVNIYAIIMAGVLYALSAVKVEGFSPYVAGFLVLFTIISLLVAVKIEAVINNFVRANEKIAEELNIADYAPIRTRHWVWKVIKFQWIFPIFYGICLIGVIIFIAFY